MRAACPSPRLNWSPISVPLGTTSTIRSTPGPRMIQQGIPIYSVSQSVIHNSTRSKVTVQYFCWISTFQLLIQLYRGADKSLARPGMKQANVYVRMAWISFGALPCRKKKNLMTARVSMSLKSRAFLTCFQAQWRTDGGVGGLNPPPEIPKSFQNCAKLNLTVKTVKNCWI